MIYSIFMRRKKFEHGYTHKWRHEHRRTINGHMTNEEDIGMMYL